ncbi:MAG: hypothetical protein ABI231_04480 [Candidatus Tumulicola sp.]
MVSVTEATVEALLLQGRTAAAGAAIASGRPENPRIEASFRRLGGGVFALAGSERNLAGTVEPALLACSSDVAAAAYLAALHDGAGAHDYLSAAVILTWSGEAAGAYRCLRAAHASTLSEGRAHVAVGALERLAHHALLFGDVTIARDAIEDALALASIHRLTTWRLRCAAAAARLALDAGDAARAIKLLDEARAGAPPVDLLALFAPTGAKLAVATEDDAALRSWTSPDILDAALYSGVSQSAVAASIACLLGTGAALPLEAPIALALRRALLLTGNAADAAELFSLAARCGTAGEARAAANALRAVVAPDRRYLAAHHLLARAHLLLRSGERAGAIDSAGDAARAFDAIGLRRWTNEAMLLLVHREGSAEPPRRRRPTAL